MELAFTQQKDSILVRSKLKQSGIQAVLDLENITEVAVNQPCEIWFDRGDGWECKTEPKLTFAMCRDLAAALATFAQLKKTLNAENPIASVVLPDGERGQIVMPPVTKKDFISMTFRKPSLQRFTLDDYEKTGRLKPNFSHAKISNELLPHQELMLEQLDKGNIKSFLQSAVQNKLNILLVGGTGSGKTTVMKAIVDEYPTEKRLFTIEDVHELSLPNHPNHVNLFYADGGVKPKAVIEACMRMKPDHVFLAELRGDEAWSYLEALNTGHTGSCTTIHANDCISAIARLADLVKQSSVGLTLDYDYIIKKVKKSIDIIAFFEHTHMKEIYFDPKLKNQLIAG